MDSGFRARSKGEGVGRWCGCYWVLKMSQTGWLRGARAKRTRYSVGSTPRWAAVLITLMIRL